MDHFSRAWSALRAAVAALAEEDFERPSGCTGWLVRDLVCHLVIDAQDVLITLATPAAPDAAPTCDAASYWQVSDRPPTGDDPLDALTVRLAAAYQDPGLLTFHLDDVGSAAGRAAVLADPALRVETKGEVLTVVDYLDAYVLEWTLHHLDLIAHLPAGAPQPPAATLGAARALLERVAGAEFPATLSDTAALLAGTGRRAPDETERAAFAAAGVRIPLSLG
ncbi:maleylpyruvate isomerase N-terminal domain-containing protein [Streptomyces sp. NPDC014779]|uniref:maleylpyruvate isomerase N-terminal domain-containing protein n=1 Tax=unclassified Streptomyces TaxID=2593676 RepID=UPI003700D908